MRWFPRSSGRGPAHALVGIVLCMIMAACGTGIEVTEHVTDKDVRRVLDENASVQSSTTLTPFEDPLPRWRVGKPFWVADDMVREMLVNQPDYDLDSVRLAGHVLAFLSSEKTALFADDDNRVDIRFEDQTDNRQYVYRFGLPKDASRPYITLPMLVDLDMVKHISNQITGKYYFIRTPIWYNRDSEQMMAGRQYIKIHIDNVMPGNTVLPLRVLFTTADTQERAMVWMSDNASTMHGRDFDALFVAADPHLLYPTISDENWSLITRGRVVTGMTKEECRLALGSPLRTNVLPDQGGMREYWYYDGGSYLFFVDGLLSQFRR